MKTRSTGFREEVLGHPIRLAVLTLFMLSVSGMAAAQSVAAPKATDQTTAGDLDPDVKALVCPKNYVEVGGLNVSDSSNKFGEYNGLNKSGLYGIGNLLMQGGDGFCQRGGNVRWEAHATDLGTTSRDFGASVGGQGKWTFGFNYDELRHYTTTGYETPFQASQGSNQFLLPPNFGAISTIKPALVGGVLPPYGTDALTATQRAAFQPQDVYNQRENTSMSAGYQLDNNWGFKFDYNHLNMTGAKLIAAASDKLNLLGATYGGESPVILMNPNQSSTDTFNFAFNWVGDKGYASAEYYASLYHDDYNSLSWTSPFRSANTATAGVTNATASVNGLPLNSMSTAPSNQYQQLKVTGGYVFSAATKVTGGASVALNTQNESFAGTFTPGTVNGLPVNSLDGEVVIWHADSRVTHQISPKLNLNAGFTYNERDNNTSSNTYNFTDINGATRTAINTPMSNKKADVDAGFDYRIDPSQKLHLGYEFEGIHRWCKNAAANNAQGSSVSGSTPAQYYVDATCVQSPDSAENRGVLKYNLTLLDRVRFNASYTYADRDSTINQAFYNPMQAVNQGFENRGYVAFFQASRRENAFKGGVTWQATDRLSFGVDGKYTYDNYYSSPLGVQNGESSRVNLTAEFDLSTDVTFGAYASWENYSYNLLSAKTNSPTGAVTGATSIANTLWGNSLGDHNFDIGLDAAQKLMGGKLHLIEDVSYGVGKSTYNTSLITLAPSVGASGSPGDIYDHLLQIRLVGAYELSKASSVSVGYLFQKLNSNDYYYNGYMFGQTPVTLLPTGQVSPNYTQNVVFVTYRYTFL